MIREGMTYDDILEHCKVEGLHSKFGLSSSARWIACPPSEWAFPDAPRSVSGAAAYMGSVHHAVAEYQILYGVSPKGTPTDEANTAKVYSNYVKALSDLALGHDGSYCDLLVEHRLVSHIDKEVGGTLDCGMRVGRVAWVVDAKFGRKKVEVVRNPQLMGYADALLEEFGWWSAVDHIYLVIVQPLAECAEGPIRVWEVSKVELKMHRARIKKALGLIRSKGGEFNPGDHCRYCSGAPVCEARKQIDGVLADFASLIKSPAKGYDPDKLAQALDFADRFDSWSKAVHEAANLQLRNGGQITGKKLVEGRSHRIWGDREKAVYVLSAPMTGACKFDDLYNKKLKSPAQVEKISPRAAKLVEKLAIHPVGKWSVVDESDPRPAVVIRESAKDDFKQLLLSEREATEETEEE